MKNDASLADDLLIGAASIAKFIFGADETRHRRKVYHLAGAGHLPVFKTGAELSARKSELLKAMSAERDESAAA